MVTDKARQHHSDVGSHVWFHVPIKEPRRIAGFDQTRYESASLAGTFLVVS
ncbi:MAG: hypothetical protein ACXW02_07040 [Halobacteriota archaeon]